MIGNPRRMMASGVRPMVLVASVSAVALLTPADATPAPPDGHTGGSPPSEGAPPVQAMDAAHRGSLASNVYLDDITYTLRLNYHRTITVSRHDPDVAYLASWDGYVFKTTDGGRTWDESRLIVERRPFFGDGGQRLYFGVHRKGIKFRNKGAGTVNASRWDGRKHRFRTLRRNVLGLDRINPMGATRRRGAADNVNFGIGLPGRAPRLQNTVRRFGKPTAGLNIKQTLYLRGSLPTEVRIVVEHPINPKVLFACTVFGLFRSEDGGLNWVRTFQGINPRGRAIFHAAVDPKNPNKVFIGTGYGLYVSEDGGWNFLKATAQGVGNDTINWLLFNPHDSRYVFAGTDFGLLRSADGGKNWRWIYFTTFPTARVVRHVHIDPHDQRAGYIATHDGLFVTKNILTAGLEDWKRLGGLRFTGYLMRQISVNPRRRGHLWANSAMKLQKLTSRGFGTTGGSFIWESVDNGRNWRVIFSGNTGGEVMWYQSDRRDPELLWIVWSRSMSRMRRKEKAEPTSPTKQAQARSLLFERLPPVQQAVMAAIRFSGTDPGLMLRYRQRARLRALVPRVHLTVTNYAIGDRGLTRDGLYLPLVFRRRGELNFATVDWRMLFVWDLAQLAFDLKATLFGRVERVNYEVRKYLAMAVVRFYGEYRRLRMLMLLRPPKDLRVRLVYRLRIEELRSYLDLVTGGYLTRYARGGRPDGIDTPWFERWPSTGVDLPVKASDSN